MIHPWTEFKTDEVKRRWKFLCEEISHVGYELAEWCEERRLPLVITESVTKPEEDEGLHRESDTHHEARAFDVRINLWPEPAIAECVKHFQERFKDVAAIGAKTGESRLVLRHVGTADHLHFQVAKRYAVRDPLISDRVV